jgi:hypothetical protein
MSEDSVYDLTKEDKVLVEQFESLSGLAQEKYLEKQGLVILDSKKEEGTDKVIWDVQLSHKIQGILIELQKEGENTSDVFARVLESAIDMFKDMSKDEIKELKENNA